MTHQAVAVISEAGFRRAIADALEAAAAALRENIPDEDGESLRRPPEPDRKVTSPPWGDGYEVTTAGKVALELFDGRGAIAVKEAAMYLGIPVSTAYHLISTDRLPHFKLGQRTLVPVVHLLELAGVLTKVSEVTP